MTLQAIPPVLFDELPDLPGALCKGVTHADVFFPSGSDMNYQYAVAQARSLCAACPEQMPCLTWALANNADGVWAGTTTKERRDLRRRPRLRIVRTSA